MEMIITTKSSYHLFTLAVSCPCHPHTYATHIQVNQTIRSSIIMVSYKICVCFTRSFGTANLQPPTDVADVFKKYTAGSAGSLTRGRYMNAEALRRFLVEEQGLTTTTTIDDAERVIEEVLKRRHHHHHLHHMGKFTRRNELSIDDFLFFLSSVELNPPINTQVHQDMTAPLSHYFIYTGHNSYLTGNQLSSDCSDVPIITALKRGVRVIELDLWPNSTKDDVHVLHGRTLTRPVTLVKCLKSIKDHAFSASPYPVILTLEDHLTPDLQAKVAQMLIETFEDMLFYPVSESDTCTEFPSPEELKCKVIISTKPPKEYLASQNLIDDKGICDHSQKRKDLDLGHVSDKALSALDYEVIADQGYDRKVESEGSDPDQAVDYGDDKQDSTGPPVYKRLITIPAKRRGKVLDESLKMDPNQVARLSLSEQALEKAAISHATDVVRFTQRNILRIFPKTTRFDSSNYNPLVGWMHGAQMVAFNMQGFGKWLWLMHGMFKANGGCGYVKKPDFIMKFVPDNNEVFNPKSNLNVKKTLKVKVYMGDGWQSDFKRTHFDSYSPPDFYVRVGIAGVPADEVMKKTKIKEDQWNPVWEEEFAFPLTVPELALLRIQVLEYDISEKDDFGGQTCLPVSELKPGIHALPLYDHKGEKYPSVKLLMRFQFI